MRLEQPIEHLHWYYVLSLLNTVISYLFVYRTTLITADQKNYVISKYQMAVKLVTFAAQTAVLVAAKNYLLYLASEVFISFLGNLAQNRAAMRMYPYLKEKALPLEKSDKSKIFSDVKSLFMYRLCGIIQTNTNNILISVMVGTIFVGYLSNYMLVITVFGSLMGLVFQSVKASIGNLMAAKENSADKKLIFDVLEYLNFLMVAFCSVGCAVLFQDFIQVSFGSEYRLPFLSVLAIVANFYTSNIRQNIWAFRETTGIFNETKYITMVTAILNLVFSIAAGKLWGMSGILWATVAARMVYAWWKEPLILYKRIFDMRCWGYIALYCARLAIAAFVFAAARFVLPLIRIERLPVQFIVRAVAYSVLACALLLLFTFRTREFRWCFARFVQGVAQSFQAGALRKK